MIVNKREIILATWMNGLFYYNLKSKILLKISDTEEYQYNNQALVRIGNIIISKITAYTIILYNIRNKKILKTIELDTTIHHIKKLGKESLFICAESNIFLFNLQNYLSLKIEKDLYVINYTKI